MSLLRSLLLAIAFAVLAVADADAMVHHIESVLPRAGQRGTTIEVAIQGTHLQDVREVAFLRPGIQAIDIGPTKPMPSPRSFAHSGRADQEVRCKFVIAADCPLGRHPFRIRTASELTVLSTFWVVPLETIEEKEGKQGDNDVVAKATPIPRSCAVLGRITTQRQADVDVYRIAGKKGEHLSAEVASVWLTEMFYAGSEADLMLRLLDADGKELARNDDSDLHIQNPIASAGLPRDGHQLVGGKPPTFKGPAGRHPVAGSGTGGRPCSPSPRAEPR